MEEFTNYCEYLCLDGSLTQFDTIQLEITIFIITDKEQLISKISLKKHIQKRPILFKK